jgi:putative peptidoglycan lipid II flippase
MSQFTGHKKNLLQKTLQVGGNTFVSRMLGLTREILLMRFLGITVFADAFTTAFMLPNSLRKIFAEGALTAAFVPTFVTIFKKEGKEQANGLMSLSFVVFESILLVLCALVMWQARATVSFIAPGYSEAQLAAAIPMLRIMMPFIFFISTSALLSGALHSVQHFFVPAFGPVLLNIVFIVSLLACLKFQLTAQFLCWTVLAGGALQCLMHVVAYLRLGFQFTWWQPSAMKYFAQVIGKFLLCFISMSVMEVNLFIDQRFASYLAVGSVTLIKYANRFMGIPLGVFAVAFSTILLPYFTKVKLEEPKRLNFYLLEATKFVFWVTLPATLILAFLSDQVFLTLFASMSSKFPAHRVSEAGSILVGFMFGLCCFSLNKILLSLYYSLHDTFYPTVISVIATLLNIVTNYYLVGIWGGFGLAVATSFSGLVQMVLCLYFLHKKHNFTLPVFQTGSFLLKYSLQVVTVLLPFYLLYQPLYNLIAEKMPYSYFFTQSFGFWFWVGPLILLSYYLLYRFKRWFGVELYFLD